MQVDVKSTPTTTATATSSRGRSSSRRYGGEVSPRRPSTPKATKNRAGGIARAADAADSGIGTREKNDGRPRTKETACVFFLRGHCKFGDGCRFSHDNTGEIDGLDVSAVRGRNVQQQEEELE